MKIKNKKLKDFGSCIYRTTISKSHKAKSVVKLNSAQTMKNILVGGRERGRG